MEICVFFPVRFTTFSSDKGLEYIKSVNGNLQYQFTESSDRQFSTDH